MPIAGRRQRRYDRLRQRAAGQAPGSALRHDARGETGWVHGFDRRRPNEIGLECSQRGDVGVEGSRIGREVLVWRELRRINEDRNDDTVGAALRQAHQRQMTGVQRAHGRHERNLVVPAVPARERAPKHRQTTDHARGMGLRS